MRKFKIPMLFLFMVLVITTNAHASTKQQNSQPIWLSGTPPTMETMKKLRRSHGGYVLQDKEGLYSKILWLRQGDALKKSDYISNAEGTFFLIDKQSNLQQPLINKSNDDTVSIQFKMPDEGYYNAYYMQSYVDEGVQYVNIAKAEVLKHSCRLGHDFDITKMQPQQNSQIPLDILRLRFDDENYHTRFSSGKNVLFKVLFSGKPLAGAEVTITTEEGWVRHSQSDADGIASFNVIQDRFKDDEHKKEKEENSRHPRRRSEQFLVTVQYKQAVAGNYKGQAYTSTVYTSTFPGVFTTPQSIYKSSAYALMIGSAGFLVLGVGTYMYRRRRIKPFKEVDLDE